MKRTIKPAVTKTFEHTISGLLAKRVELAKERDQSRSRLGEIRNDIAAIDHVLVILGYKADADSLMPRQRRVALFGRGELRKAILGVLQAADAPMTTKQIAQVIAADRGWDIGDRDMLTDLANGVSKACRQCPERTIRKATDAHGSVVWSKSLATSD